MKSFWSISAKALFVIVLLQAWFLYDMYRQNTALTAVNDEYSAYLKDSEEKIAKLQTQLAETEKKTLDGILNETNKAVVQGWESLLNKVEQELEKAKSAVPELLDIEPLQDDNAGMIEAPVEPEITPMPEESQDKEITEEPSTGSEPTTPPVLIPGDVT